MTSVQADPSYAAPIAAAPEASATPTIAAISSQFLDAFQMVQQYNPLGTGFFLLALRRSFFDGDLLTIGFREPGGRDVMNFILKKGSDLQIFRNESQILDTVARESATTRGLATILNAETVPGFIAILITVCIVVLLFQHPQDPKVPDVLSSGLALILGFYFGRKAT